jgi:ABC-type molybdate transport system substrate-binding protein
MDLERGADDEKQQVGAVKAAVTELAKRFTGETGHTVTFTFATIGASLQMLAAGEAARALIAFLARPSARDTFAAVGMDYRE